MKFNRWQPAVAAVLVLAVLTSACSSGAEAGGALKATEVTGAVVSRPSVTGDWKQLRVGETLGPGAEVKTPDAAWVRLASGDTSFELAPGGWAIIDAADSLTLKAGRVLANSKDPVGVADESGVAVHAARSTWRFDLGLRVAVYRGIVSVSLPAAPADVPANRELTLGTSVADLQSISVDEADRWDARFLADVISLDRQLKPYTRSFDANYASAPSNATFYGRFVDPSALGFLPPLLSNRMADYGKLDILLALFVGLDASSIMNTSLAKAVDQVTLFRDELASWGLVAHEFGVKPAALLDRLIVALTPGGKPQTVPPPIKNPRRPTGSTLPSPTPTKKTKPTPTPTPSHSNPTPTPTGSASPSPSPSPSPTASCSVVDALLGRC